MQSSQLSWGNMGVHASGGSVHRVKKLLQQNKDFLVHNECYFSEAFVLIHARMLDDGCNGAGLLFLCLENGADTFKGCLE
jgi:hypothetical protein